MSVDWETLDWIIIFGAQCSCENERADTCGVDSNLIGEIILAANSEKS